MFLIMIIVIRYLLSLENWLELLLLSLLAFLLLAPDDLQDCSCQVEGHAVQEDHDHCELVILTSIIIVKIKKEKRHIAAVVLLLAWTEFVLLSAKHPRLARYNVYSSMFVKVIICRSVWSIQNILTSFIFAYQDL